MADLVKSDKDETLLKLHNDDQEAILIVSKDGEVVVMNVSGEPMQGDELPPNAWIVHGLAAAIFDPELFEEVQALAAKGHDRVEELEAEQEKTLAAGPKFH